MNIGQIGGKIPDIESIAFNTHSSLFEYDFILLDINAIPLFYSPGVYKLSHVSLTNYNLFINDCNRRSQELNIYMASGKKLAVFLPTMQKISQQHGQSSIELTSIFPFFRLETTKLDGKKFELNKSNKLYDFFNKYKEIFNYNSHLNVPVENEIAKIKEIDKPISFYRDNIIYLPDFVPNSLTNSTFRTQFLDDLFEAFNLIIPKSEEIDYPNWISNYFIFNEKDLIDGKAKISSAIKKLQGDLEQSDKEMNDLKAIKLLLFGSGGNLEKKVIDIFAEFGFEILEVDPNRDDAIIKYHDHPFVLEVKGLKNSAAEKNAAQLEKWVAEYLIANNAKPKGLLIVNAFKEKTLNERNEDAFPHQMLSFSTNREHCLLTTTQLLCLLIEFRNKKITSDEISKSLLETNGIYSKYQDWSPYIEFLDISNISE